MGQGCRRRGAFFWHLGGDALKSKTTVEKKQPPAKKAARKKAAKRDEAAKPKPTVVAIGASAGGLAALRTFFANVPADSGLAFVVVVHLSPEHKSLLADLLQPHVKMPVLQVTAATPLEANRVYVIPPNANLDAIDTHLRLTKLEEERRERAPIDHFLRTLASSHDGGSIAVILTGTGSDGTLGIKDIKAKGGLVVVQDPNEAEYDGMPQSAIASGLPDVVLPLAEMPAALLQFGRITPNIKIPTEEDKLERDEAQLLQKILAQLRARTDRDFSRYKRSTILRRIARRMQLNYVEDVAVYLRKLREHPEEARALAEDLLITVTNFFRDPEVFAKLESDVVPRLFEGKEPTDTVRVWSVGCATGEEAYSLAILLLEEAARQESPPRIQVFASDLHRRSLDRAREGLYPGDITTDVSPERLKKYFQRENGAYRIHKEVRDLVVFAPHNLLGDPPFSRLDLISCRNLLIYLQRDVQRDVVELFHYALNPRGYLILGSAETIEASELFKAEDKSLRLYAKRNVPAPEPRLPVFPQIARLTMGAETTKGPQPEPVPYGTLLQRALQRHIPPSLLIDAENKLAQIAGGAGRYLSHPSGDLTSNVFKLVRDELRLELRAALQTVRDSKGPADSLPIPLRFNGEAVTVVMHARQVVEPGHEDFVLVMFEDGGAVPAHRAAKKEAAVREAQEKTDKRADELETELNITRQRLQALVEEYETSQEEMKAANEEMQSTNEELRSTMEELETSKEELQSINEELQTVNQENRHKVEELAQLSDDLQNLLAATDIATLFLDRDLRIMRFTPKLCDLFNILSTDRGRPISDLTHRLGYDKLQEDARSVLKRLIPVEREVTDRAGRWYLTRVRPYRSSDDRIEGTVITFIDITKRRQYEEAVRQSEERYRLLVESAHEYAIFMIDLDGRISTWNAGAERIFGFSVEEAIGLPGSVIFTEEDQHAGVHQAAMETAARTGRAGDDRWQARKDGTRFWANGAMEALRDPDGSLRGYVKVLRDNTERKEAEENLKQLNETLEDRVRTRTQEVRELSSTLTMAEHRERDRIAQVLHDDLQQRLYSLRMKLGFLRETLEEGNIEKSVDRVAQFEAELGKSVELARRLSIDLSPQVLKQEGLREMIGWLAEQMKEQHQLEVDLQADSGFRSRQSMRVLLFQAIRELLFNVIKHAGVKHAKVELRQGDGALLVRVSDSGDGFEPVSSEAGFGLSSIGHRLSLMGGSLELDSRPGSGTTVTLSVPLELLQEETE